ncbi:MAG: hypothetical protein HY435_01350 [Candidatus Liptonbacteria bacterium]|nr:hypothetical protein [Candidatus Liptonbacteria bacterium]
MVTWNAAASGGVLPHAFLWSGDASGTSSTVVFTYNTTGTKQAAVRVNDSATSTVNASCSATITTLPAATTTPPVGPRPLVKERKLEINPAGRFLGRGMIVQSVASTSFTAKVFGIVWTIDTSGLPELVFREGRELDRFDINQIQVGDEVSVQGAVDENISLVVRAHVVRNFSIARERPRIRVEIKIKDEDKDEKDRGKLRVEIKGKGLREEEAQNIRDQIKKILEQISDLQGKIRIRTR